jgi:hypothetical protein
MWWEVLVFGVAFLLGYLGAELVRGLRRPRSPSITNPYLGDEWHQQAGREHRHTRPPGWHP